MNNKSTHPRTIQEVSASTHNTIVAKMQKNVNSQKKKLGVCALSRVSARELA